MSVEKSMEHYTLYFKDVCLGALTVDSLSGEYAFEPDTAGVQLAREETVLIREIEEGTSGFVPPIPFFQVRIGHMKRSHVNVLRYHTDYFVLQRQN